MIHGAQHSTAILRYCLECSARLLDSTEDALQRVCCLYLECERIYRQKVPVSFATDELLKIRKSCPVSTSFSAVFELADLLDMHSPRFMLRHLDPDLQQAMERSVPPLDISIVSEFAASLARHSKQAGPDGGLKMRVTQHIVYFCFLQVSDDAAKAAEKPRAQHQDMAVGVCWMLRA